MYFSLNIKSFGLLFFSISIKNVDLNPFGCWHYGTFSTQLKLKGIRLTQYITKDTDYSNSVHFVFVVAVQPAMKMEFEALMPDCKNGRYCVCFWTEGWIHDITAKKYQSIVKRNVHDHPYLHVKTCIYASLSRKVRWVILLLTDIFSLSNLIESFSPYTQRKIQHSPLENK